LIKVINATIRVNKRSGKKLIVTAITGNIFLLFFLNKSMTPIIKEISQIDKHKNIMN
jgi:hypothetical protein